MNSNDNEFNPTLEQLQAQTRRHFLQGCAGGLGAMFMGSVAGLAPQTLQAATPDAGEEARLDYAARCVLSRELSADEQQTLTDFVLNAERASGAGSSKERAAYTALASVLFNLDAALTR